MEIVKKGISDVALVKTARGTLKIYENAWGSDYPGIAIDFIPDGGDYEPGVQIAVIEDVPEENGDNISIKTWDDAWTDEYTHESQISVKEIKEALESEA